MGDNKTLEAVGIRVEYKDSLANPIKTHIVSEGNFSTDKSRENILLTNESMQIWRFFPMRIYISKIITMNNENSNELFSI